MEVLPYGISLWFSLVLLFVLLQNRHDRHGDEVLGLVVELPEILPGELYQIAVTNLVQCGAMAADDDLILVNPIAGVLKVGHVLNLCFARQAVERFGEWFW
jgi:hypothetical protein